MYRLSVVATFLYTASQFAPISEDKRKNTKHTDFITVTVGVPRREGCPPPAHVINGY